jgi:exopolysaccharide biosynthesis predicted pyruvyltransferase EpsI
LSQAKLIAIRTPQHLSKIKEINTNTISIPDMVYYLKPYVQKSNVQPNSVLVLPNMAVVPQWQDPHWKHVSWEYFKSEFAQFLDSLVDQKYNVKFLAMCQNNKINDNWAAIEVINKMKNRHSNYVLDTLGCDIKTITSCISGYEFIITQRFHGIVLSELVGRPYLSIYHHDKLKHSLAENGNSVSYYGISKMQMHENLLSVQRTNLSSILPIEDNIFEALREKVINLINDG